MTGGPTRAVLRPGDWVSFDGGEHQVLAVAGTSVRLRAQDGAEQVVLASYLMAAPDFAVTGVVSVPGWSRSGFWTACPRRWWPQRGTGNATWKSRPACPGR